MRPASRSRPAKKPVNLSINSDLLTAARELKINLSATLEMALAEAITGRQRERWLADNRAAISAFNERVDRDGVFSEGLRKF